MPLTPRLFRLRGTDQSVMLRSSSAATRAATAFAEATSCVTFGNVLCVPWSSAPDLSEAQGVKQTHKSRIPRTFVIVLCACKVADSLAMKELVCFESALDPFDLAIARIHFLSDVYNPVDLIYLRRSSYTVRKANSCCWTYMIPATTRVVKFVKF